MSPSTSARPTDPDPGVASAFRRTSRRRFLQVSAAAVGGALLHPCSTSAQQVAPRISTTDLGGVTLVQGAGCNVIAMPGPDGALMIDGGLAANAEALLAAVKGATRSSRIHTLINTHWHPEQTGANEAVGRGGGVIFAHEKTKVYLSNAVYSVTFKGRRPALPAAARPDRQRDRAPPRHLSEAVHHHDWLSKHGPRPRRRRATEPAQGIPVRIRRSFCLRLWRSQEHDDRLRAGLSLETATREGGAASPSLRAALSHDFHGFDDDHRRTQDFRIPRAVLVCTRRFLHWPRHFDLQCHSTAHRPRFSDAAGGADLMRISAAAVRTRSSVSAATAMARSGGRLRSRDRPARRGARRGLAARRGYASAAAPTATRGGVLPASR
jgi:hypothetical protein